MLDPGPAVEDLTGEVADLAPVDADIGVLEVALEESPGAFRIEVMAHFGVDLDGDVGVVVAPLTTALGHQAAEQDAEVPVVEAKAEKKQSGVNQGAANDGGDQLVIPGQADEVVEVVVLG